MATLAEGKALLKKLNRDRLQEKFDSLADEYEVKAAAFGVLPSGRQTAIATAMQTAIDEFTSFKSAIDAATNKTELKTAFKAWVDSNNADRDQFKRALGKDDIIS